MAAVSTYTFSKAFTNYGETASTLDQEIRNDVKQVVLDSVKSRPFELSEGVGIESLENESLSFAEFSLYRSQIVVALMAYNDSVAPERQIVTSQELIELLEGDAPSELFLNIRYIQLKDLQLSGGNPPPVQSILQPLIGGSTS